MEIVKIIPALVVGIIISAAAILTHEMGHAVASMLCGGEVLGFTMELTRATCRVSVLNDAVLAGGIIATLSITIIARKWPMITAGFSVITLWSLLPLAVETDMARLLNNQPIAAPIFMAAVGLMTILILWDSFKN